MDEKQALEKLTAAGQEHVMKYFEELTKEQKEMLLSQIETTDFTVLSSLKDRKEESVRGRITPLAAMQLD